ncbi:MAG: hypothetical protein QF464_01220, partial [Myxococcota bacterium]|nr:hypothetical protein [Myxococcota bacterium]
MTTVIPGEDANGDVTTDAPSSPTDADAGGGTSCPGCFGQPCDDHLDCNSGWCVQGPSGLSCTKFCETDCPQGYSCDKVATAAGDPTFLCIYNHVHYCRPCESSTDCRPPLVETSEARCYEASPGNGSFCATPCWLDSDCPADSQCVTIEVGAETRDVCQPLAGDCTCSQLATNAEASTSCYNTNDHGTCEGTRSCTTEGLTECSGGVPAAETCNGGDDDCDGEIDEEMVDEGLACDGDDEDSCEDGVTSCEDGTLVCLDDPTSGETCNGADDDCDGQIDEDIAGMGELCDGDDDDECADGVLTCVSGEVVCDDGEASVTESCNGTDDDCDGQVDETFAEEGTPCDGEDADACEEGEWVCTDGGLSCTDVSDDNIEVCGNGDDDCDGQIDETFALATTPCDGDDADECADGVLTCVGGELVCDDNEASAAESCNGADDDCDGAVDEAFAEKGTPCDGSDADACEEGEWICTDGGLSCTDVSDDNIEVCDNGDDDC